MRSRLHTVLTGALVLALVAATVSVLGALQYVPVTGSAVAAMSLSDDDSSADAGLAIAPQPLAALALLGALFLVSIKRRSPAYVGTGESHQARAPPSC